MSCIVILGAGVMGSALAFPAATDVDNRAILVGSPLDDDIIDALRDNRHHPTLDVELPQSIHCLKHTELDDTTLRDADSVVFGVSSPGIGWACDRMAATSAAPDILALVTKGIVAHPDGHSPPSTYADALPAGICRMPQGIVGIGGPCIARELALGYPTRVTFASRHRPNAEALRHQLKTASYRIVVNDDIVGVEACAALKNFLCIGVSAMFTAHRLGDSHAKNPLAALFNQAVLELALLADWITEASLSSSTRRPDDNLSVDSSTALRVRAISQNAAFDLAGMGDLHVTVGGGRNSRLGHCLGDGATLAATMAGPMHGVTVEGVDTGLALSAGLHHAIASGTLTADALPLTLAILDVIEKGSTFALDFRDLPE